MKAWPDGFQRGSNSPAAVSRDFRRRPDAPKRAPQSPFHPSQLDSPSPLWGPLFYLIPTTLTSDGFPWNCVSLRSQNPFPITYGTSASSKIPDSGTPWVRWLVELYDTKTFRTYMIVGALGTCLVGHLLFKLLTTMHYQLSCVWGWSIYIVDEFGIMKILIVYCSLIIFVVTIHLNARLLQDSGKLISCPVREAPPPPPKKSVILWKVS